MLPRSRDQLCAMTGMWRDRGSSQRTKALQPILRGLSPNFDASLYNEHSPTYESHENLTDFFSYRFCSLFSLVARNRFTGAHTCLHLFFLPTTPSASEVSFRGNTSLQLPLRSCFLCRIPCNTYNPHCRYKKNTTGCLGNQNKGPDI